MPPKLDHLKKIRVAAVNYLNTKPLLYGIKRSALFNEIDLIEDYPARVAQMIMDGSADVGLIPVAVIPKLKESYIITDYCIGCNGPVASVCIFSEVPIEKVEKVFLDYQSRTSVMLAKILLKEYWNSNAELIDANGEDFRAQIKGTTAGLVIGDRALEQRQHSTYIYDLGEAWKAHTGLPFVFAAWVSNKKLPGAFINEFNVANGLGFQHLEEVIRENQSQVKTTDLYIYYQEHISYKFDKEKQDALLLFLKKIRMLHS